MTEKKCIGCGQEKPRTEFWSAGTSPGVLASRCKPCHVIKRREYKWKYQKKPTGFNKLPEETRKGVLEMLSNDPKPKLTSIAKTFNINYPSLCRWHKKGLVKMIAA